MGSRRSAVKAGPNANGTSRAGRPRKSATKTPESLARARR